MNKETHERATRITKELAEKGRLVEGGWRAYVVLCGLEKVSPVQLNETEKAFYAGAQHVFASMINFMDTASGAEATEGDMKKMDLLHQELEGFILRIKREWNARQ